MNARDLGHYRIHGDGSIKRMLTTLSEQVRDGATKRLVATFGGSEFIAERDGSELKIYAILDDDGSLGSVRTDLGRSTATDAPGLRGSPAAINRANRKHYNR